MTRLCMLWAALLLLAGCGSSSTVPARPSKLQDLDGLEPLLARVTAQSRRTARDEARLRRVLARNDAESAGRLARALSVNAVGLQRASGVAAVPLRALAARTTSRDLRGYVRAELATLSASWWEGYWLRKVSKIVRGDPDIRTQPDVAALQRTQGQAQRSAWHAYLRAREAKRYLATHRRSFRYVVVPTPEGGM